MNKRADGDVGQALVAFLHWMSKYDRLFQDPCKIANKLVATDAGTGEPLPPTLRTASGDALFPQSLAGVPQRPVSAASAGGVQSTTATSTASSAAAQSSLAS